MSRLSEPVAVLLLFLALAGCQTAKEFTYRESTPVRISELHFAPSSEQGDLEFVEITNVTESLVDLSRWAVTGAGRVVMPEGTVLGPGDALVLCQDDARYKEVFPNARPPVAELPGKLKGKGETVRIEDAVGNVADEVVYDSADAEVAKAAGTGSSIHRVAGSSSPGRWQAATPTPGTAPKS